MCLGLEVARHPLAKFADGAWAIELAPLSDPDFVPAALARALGLDPADNVISPERVANTAAKRLPLLLDKLRASVRRCGKHGRGTASRQPGSASDRDEP
jgi:predicted ATPase